MTVGFAHLTLILLLHYFTADYRWVSGTLQSNYSISWHTWYRDIVIVSF